MNKIIKPRRLLVIGWAWLIFASLSLIDTVLNVIKIVENKEQLQRLFNNPPPELANTVELISPFYHNFYVLILFKMFLAAAGIVLAINFLRLKKWAYRLLEILTWCMLLIIIASIVFSVKYNASVAMDGLEWRGLNAAIIVLTIFSVPFLLICWQLRSRTIREVFQINNGT